MACVATSAVLLAAAVLGATPPRRTVRVIPVAGSGQRARAFADVGSPRFATEFSNMLVVRFVPKPAAGDDRHVKFRCVTDRCAFGAADQPDLKLVDHPLPAVYDITVAPDGTASVRVTLMTSAAAGRYTVRAEPVPNEGERAVDASFTLTTY